MVLWKVSQSAFGWKYFTSFKQNEGHLPFFVHLLSERSWLVSLSFSSFSFFFGITQHENFSSFHSFLTSPYLPSILEAERTSGSTRMTSVSQHVSQPKPKAKENTKTRNEAPYDKVWVGKLRQNTTRRTARIRHEHFNVRREVLLWGFL